MTPGDIRKRVAQIGHVGEVDSEAAHRDEDQLYQDVLQHFADQGYGVAIAALETKKLTFARHCA